jgi:HEAT repeat protein
MAGPASAQTKPPEKPPKPDQPESPDRPSITEIGGKTLQQWIQEARHPDPGVRENAVRTIMLFGPSAAPAVPVLIERLTDVDVSLRANAAIALAAVEIGNADIPKVVDALARRATEDTESLVRFQACVTLARFGKEAKAAIPHLINASRDSRCWEVRKAACFALGRAGMATKNDPLDMRAANALMHVLSKDPSAKVRLEAATALGTMGRPAQQSEQTAIENALLARAKDQREDRAVQIWSAVGVMAIRDEVPEEYLVAIAKQLDNPDLGIRTHAARALGTIGPRARSRVPDLTKLLKDKQREGIVAALWALVSIGGDADKAIPALKELAERKDVDEGLREAAKEAIQVISGKKKSEPQSSREPSP